jgi:hypothetical protein
VEEGRYRPSRDASIVMSKYVRALNLASFGIISVECEAAGSSGWRLCGSGSADGRLMEEMRAIYGAWMGDRLMADMHSYLDTSVHP